MTINNKNDLNTKNILKDKYEKVNEIEHIDNKTLQGKKEFNIYREAEQIGEHIAFEYDGNSEKRSRLKEKLRNI
jgi:hypothetical protein